MFDSKENVKYVVLANFNLASKNLFVDTSKRFTYYSRMAKSPKVEKHSLVGSLIPSFVRKRIKKFSNRNLDITLNSSISGLQSKTKVSFNDKTQGNTLTSEKINTPS